MPPRKEPPKDSVSPETFIEAWNGSDDIAEVAHKVGRTLRSVSERASRLRRLGITLKKFKNIGNSFTEDRIRKLQALSRRTS